ncbi:hypothetical protein [Streptomyces chattanoogensis]|uniref:hypothetical protein n=1 Tax=Streptomyces chattanoogensis TaxID=66876 RepID=UPI0036CC07B6
MSENTQNIEEHAEGAAHCLVELVIALENGVLEYPLEAHRIHSYLTRVAGEMGTALDLIQACVQGLHEKGRLMSDYRGEPLEDVLQRFNQSSGRARVLARELNNHLSEAYSAVGHLAYKDVPDKEREATAN